MKICKNCKKEARIWKKGVCYFCAKKLYPPKIAKKSPVAKKKRKSKFTPVKRLDIIFSQYVRLSRANKSGRVRCYTCGSSYSWKRIQNGHYIGRSNMATRYHEMNCHPQCTTCNCTLGGNLEVYRTNLLRDYGEENVKVLEALGKTVFRPDIAALIEKYKQLLAEIKTKHER